MKMTSLIFGALVACGGQVATESDSGAPAPDANLPSTNGVVIHACGPTDGVVHDLGPSGHGLASVCTFAGCQSGAQGSLVVTTFDTSNDVASGHYTFTTPDAKVHAASFTNIPICSNPATCG